MLYGALLDFGTASLAGGGDVLRRFATMYFGTSLPWNLAHAAGNVAFALAFGPALLRALTRFRRRFSVTWRAAPAAPLAALALLLALVPASALAATPADYLRRAQNADGGWGGARGERTSPLYTGWAALGLAAAGTNPLDLRRGGHTPIDVLRRGAGRLRIAGDLERTILVLGAAGLSPRDFGGRDLVAALAGHRHRDGSFDGQVNLTAFGIFALRAAGAPPTDAAVRRAAAWLVRQQERAGGWNYFRRGAASTADDTGAVLQALAATGRARTRAARRGARWLVVHQRRDGGYAGPGGASNAQSTAWAVQGLVAVGRDPGRVHRHGARSPLAYLRSLIAPSGLVRYSRTSAQTPVWVTAQTALALRRRPFPLTRVARRPAAHAPAPGPSPVRPVKPPPTIPPRPQAAPSRRSAPGVALRSAAPQAAVRRSAALTGLSRSVGAAAALVFAPLSAVSR
jgi:energy-coupling factor transport system substrate-specific component